MGQGKLMRLLRSSAPEGHRPETPRHPATRVLLVDGEPAVRVVLAQALRDQGCVVLETDGQELRRQLPALAEEPVDLVISDVQTLEPLGLAALADLRRVDWVMPILLIASDDPVETRRQARRLQATAVLPRSVQASVLKQTVCDMIPRV